MNKILDALRHYQAIYGYLPCPANGTLGIGTTNFGVAAANGGTANNCMGGTPAANYADTTNNIAIGIVPVTTLGLSNDTVIDSYGRDITYAVDTNATACWQTTSLSGKITVLDNGISQNTIAVLVSHGADGYGAWLPLDAGTSGGGFSLGIVQSMAAVRFDSGSLDTAQADNAQVAHGGGLTANTVFQSFVKKPPTKTFDDMIVYKSPRYNLNFMPLTFQLLGTVTIASPGNGIYSTGSILTFTLTYPTGTVVTVNTANGTPQLDITAISGNNSSVGASGTAYAAYTSGSGTNQLTFQYTIMASDFAPNGLTVSTPIDLNGGSISSTNLCFAAPNLSKVYILPNNDGADMWWNIK